jgi:hypothetical protein
VLSTKKERKKERKKESFYHMVTLKLTPHVYLWGDKHLIQKLHVAVLLAIFGRCDD